MQADNELSDFQQLSKMGSKEPFVAPEQYFESFNSRLRDRMAEVENKSVFRLRPVFILTAVTAIVAVVVLFNRSKNTIEPVAAPEYTDLTESEYFYQLDEEQISEAYAVVFSDSLKSDADSYLLQQIDEETLTSNL